MQTVKLNTGGVLPAIGYGTWQLDEGDQAYNAVSEALHAGYRLVDTAKMYGNEVSVGKAIQASGIAREDIFVTTKLWTSDQGYDRGLRAFEESLANLGMEYVDLYVIHWPGDDLGRRSESWRALIDIQASERAKAIGVCNYNIEQLKEVLSSSTPPAVNQIEFHPFRYGQQKPLLDFCKQHGIVVEAYSPLAQSKRMDDPVITKVAERVQRTPAQVLLRWGIQHGAVPIPKSSHRNWIQENIKVFDFELSDADMASLNSLSDAGSLLH